MKKLPDIRGVLLFFIKHSLVIVVFTLRANADVKLPSILSDNMVLQQNAIIKIWGWAEPHEKITMNAPWLKKEINTITGKDGKWSIRLQTIQAGGPYSLVIKGKNTITINNILLGEVWLCSGQSNMEFTMKQFGGWKNFPAELKDFTENDYSMVRLCTIGNNFSNSPLDDCNVVWAISDTSSVNNFSETAWFFGRELSKMLKVPVALIASDWSGTPAEAWTPSTVFTGIKELNYYKNADTSKNYLGEQRSSNLYNAMIHPLRNFIIKGVIWYQGESNIYDADLYDILFPAMVHAWRKAWNIGDFPFYYVQIAPYDYKSACNASAYLREAQSNSLKKISNSAMVVTLDIGDNKDIHPARKQEVGRRLALLALKRTYLRKDLPEYDVPEFDGFAIEGQSIRIRFKNSNWGLKSNNKILKGFEIAASDLNFTAAQAEISGDEILVFSEKIINPVAVRYAFSDTASACLFSNAGFPISSFRTDHPPLFYREAKIEVITDTINKKIFATLSCNDTNTLIRYTLDGSTPDSRSTIYREKILLNTSLTLKTRVFKDDKPSQYIGTHVFEKHKGNFARLQYITTPDEKYKGNQFTLSNGIHGTTNFLRGEWQGFSGNDLIVQYSFSTAQEFSQINVSFLQSINSWIFAPSYVEVFKEDSDGNFILVEHQNSNCDLMEKESFIKTFTFKNDNFSTSKIKIVAKNIGLCPVWHKGANKKAWLFVDEIELY